jgi:predicted naringenin-chalcone synthase
MNAVLRALATANPQRYATQQEICGFFEAHFNLQPQERDLYRKILLDGPIHGRHIAVDYDEQICSEDPDEQIGRFLKQGRRIAGEAARRALNQARLQPTDVAGMVVNTCTGYLCPGLSSYLAEDLGLKNLTSVIDIAGMGCGAAIPNLECASRMTQRAADRAILSIAVEVCSATFFRGPEPDLIVSNSIFADGASAVILTAGNSSVPEGLLGLLDFESGIFPEYREHLRYRSEGGRLRNVLRQAVPVIGARTTAQITQRLLGRHALAVGDIDWWAVHPGGTSVLERIQKELGLSSDQLRFSYEVFHHYGNMSSPSVLFVLDKILRDGRPRSRQKGLLLSFGAGFTAFAGLVEFL